jgi:hypothetical protein
MSFQWDGEDSSFWRERAYCRTEYCVRVGEWEYRRFFRDSELLAICPEAICPDDLMWAMAAECTRQVLLLETEDELPDWANQWRITRIVERS